MVVRFLTRKSMGSPGFEPRERLASLAVLSFESVLFHCWRSRGCSRQQVGSPGFEPKEDSLRSSPRIRIGRPNCFARHVRSSQKPMGSPGFEPRERLASLAVLSFESVLFHCWRSRGCSRQQVGSPGFEPGLRAPKARSIAKLTHDPTPTPTPCRRENVSLRPVGGVQSHTRSWAQPQIGREIHILTRMSFDGPAIT